MRLLAIALAIAIAIPCPSAAARAAGFLHRLTGPGDVERLQAILSGVPYVKLLVRRGAASDPVYYFDSRRYPMHIDFLRQELVTGGAPGGWEMLNRRNLTAPDRDFIYGTLACFRGGAGAAPSVVWALEIFEGDRMDADLALLLYRSVRDSFFAGDQLRFKPASDAQAAMAARLAAQGVPVITAADLFGGRDYFVLAPGRAIGRLRIVDRFDPGAEVLFDRRDVVILGELPGDITPVAGILTTTFTTPLSHVNMRATAWGIPNGYWKDAATQARAAGLEGKVVVLDVAADAARPSPSAATAEEVAAWEQQDHERPRVSPGADLGVRDLADLADLRATGATAYGAKAANLGEVWSLARELSLPAAMSLMSGDMKLLFAVAGADPGLPQRLRLATSRERARLLTRGRLLVPDGFAVPFAAYRDFLDHPANAAAAARITSMATDPRFRSDAAYRKTYLAELRALIQAGRMPQRHEEAIRAKLAAPPYARTGVFVRSSTNAEDLPGFNGAGLYDTVPNVVGADAVVRAVLKVWASVWNFKAHEEREYFGIRHEHVYPGVLIQVGVDAEGAGVLITCNPFEPQDASRIFINARRGLGIGVVDGVHVPEQILLDTFDLNLSRISRASGGTIFVFDPEGGIREVPAPDGGAVVVDERKVHVLAFLSRLIEAHFAHLAGTRRPQDIEWLTLGDRVFVVQSRPYIRGSP
jgi:hypothetical protein